jgi:Uma2 family endonuclease
MVATKTRYTFADLLAMEPTDHLYELLGGELVVFAAPNEPHAAAVMELALLLGEAQRAGYGRARIAPCAVAFDYAERGLLAQDVPQPDLFFVREERRSIMGYRCVEGTPDLVVEVVSPNTRADDLPGGRKWQIYERYGVPYYWLIDPNQRTVMQYTWHDGHFGEPVVLQAGDTLSCPLFPGITRDVASIFASAVSTSK